MTCRCGPDSAEALGSGLFGLASIYHPEHVGTPPVPTTSPCSAAGRASARRRWPTSRLRADDVVPLGDDIQSQCT